MTTTFRQSLLRSFEVCPRRAMMGRQIDDDLSTGNVGASADLGSAFHAIAAEILRTLWAQGERQMPTQEGVEVMYEILGRGAPRDDGDGTGPWVLPADERDTLRSLVLSFCSYYEWDTARILPNGIEHQMLTEIACPDGEIRTLTGRPDLLMADPPDGIKIVDWKTGWPAGMRSPRNAPPKGEAVQGKEYLSDRGHFQLDVYGLLALREYPRAQRAVLSEIHLRTGERREASLGRDELEHVEREIGLQLMLLDRAVTEGEASGLWKPRPGRQCLRQCPVARSCPIPAEQRGIGALETPELASGEASRFVVIDALRQTMRDSLKAHHEETGAFIALPDGSLLGWHAEEDGGRAFEIRAGNGGPVLPERIDCPKCSQPAGEPCRGTRGFLKRPHPARLAAAVKASCDA